MTVSEDRIRQLIEKRTSIRVSGTRFFAAGQNTDLYLVDSADEKRFIAKVATGAVGHLDLEGWMLKHLNDKAAIPVPGVLYAQSDFLLMDYIPSTGSLGLLAEEDAARLLARLHAVSADAFGFEKDTIIGPYRQPNSQHKSWIDFFRDNRLLYMAQLALKEGAIPPALLVNIEKLAGKLDQYLPRSSTPALIHGDVWGGNVLATQSGIKAFIDPAIYYADAEIELAFIALFSTFGERFFAAYGEIHSISPDFWQTRKDIYNLYPLLVHTRLYGGTYLETLQQIVHCYT